MLKGVVSERENFLDFLRGFSLLGILTVNLPILAGIHYHSLPLPFESELGKAIIAFFFTGKFFILFSFVFGYGFSILLSSLENKNLDAKKIFYKRILGLGVLGLIHGVFFFEGDILFTYSLLGFFLFKFKDSSEERIFKFIIIFWILSVIFYGLCGYGQFYKTSQVAQDPNLKKITEEIIAGKLNGFWTGAFQRAQELIVAFTFVVIPFNMPSAFMMFLFGIYSGKKKLLSDPEKIWNYAKGKKRYIFIVALFSNLGYTFSNYSHSGIVSFLLGALLSLGGISLSLIYVLLLIRIIFMNRSENLFVRLISSAGKMSLSNYILQSVLAGFIFYGWGFGYYTKLEVDKLFLVITCIYSCNLIFSHFWLKLYDIGPLEFVLRKWMYYDIDK
ncbi:MAG: DUF418 domain-containing protein [Leptospiraceae bacterium]|nr:DUF418 domain-containing protein [Leptospiraceae bacterium]